MLIYFDSSLRFSCQYRLGVLQNLARNYAALDLIHKWHPCDHFLPATYITPPLSDKSRLENRDVGQTDLLQLLNALALNPQKKEHGIVVGHLAVDLREQLAVELFGEPGRFHHILKVHLPHVRLPESNTCPHEVEDRVDWCVFYVLAFEASVI